jgi:BON domain
MATLEHVELNTLRAGMPVVLGGTEIGRLEDVIPQPDRKHALRLITRQPDNRLIAIPIEWVRGVRDARIELWVTTAEIGLLPEYIPPILVSEARQRVQRALDSDPILAGEGIRVTERDGTLELSGTVSDAAVRAAASGVARGIPGVGPVRNLINTRAEPQMSATGYGFPWLHTLLERTTGLDFDETQLARIEDIAEQKLVDLFDVA